MVAADTPIQCVVSSDPTTLPSGFGTALTVLGGIAQTIMGQRVGLSKKVSWAAPALLLAISFAAGEDSMPVFWRTLGLQQFRIWLSAVLFLWFLCMLSAGMILAAIEAVRTLATRRGEHSPALAEKEVLDAQRRRFLAVSTAAACAVPAGAFGYGFINRKDFQINQIDLKFPELPEGMNGLRILQISDIHMGVFYTAKDLERVVAAGNSLHPDITFITGDLITTDRDPLDRCLMVLSRLRAGSGLWGCMGNHERYSKVEDHTTKRGSQLGIRFLRNEATTLRFGGSKLNLAGVDYRRRGPYLDSVAGLVDLDSFNLLLAHTPEVFPEAAERGFDLTLSGHTHGGQVNLELLGTNLNIAEVHTPYTKGLYTLPTSMIYVNSGLGTIGAPLRLGAPAEITSVRLCKA